MTLMALRPNSRTVNSSWHSSVAALPAKHRPATPFDSREWAAVWQSVRTEQVRGRHHLFLQDGPRQHRMSRTSASKVGWVTPASPSMARHSGLSLTW
ncbi:hypothetical protein [Streptomyces aureocirculatus]|uniref:hypothetical protein n=1 Tax=Streptomyces aureocirculatus TaxID=67275 RepID=UPI0004C6BA2A|nr:hypothetical protein [Streptomyces aureocirculatus]